MRDDGPGVSPELRESLFDVFTSTKGRGRGLGLAGIRAMLRRRGGDIRLRDVDGPGACFEVTLPTVGH